MITISLCMIVRDEEDVLSRCLESVKEIADEIIIVDTGSQDHTKAIAAQYTDKIFDFPWIDDFSAARNFAFAQASQEYCLWLDADDVILPEEQEKFMELKKTLDPKTDVVMMKYHTVFDTAGNPTFTYYRERLLKNGRGFQWQGAIHETITPTGNIIHSDIAIAHKKLHPSDPDRNLRIFTKQKEKGIPFNPREEFYYARELYYHQQYAEAIQVFQQFLVNPGGWLENKIDACQLLANCYQETNQPDFALSALFQSFFYDTPRGEACCAIGKHFLEKKQYQQAIYWYQTALSCQPQPQKGGFVRLDCYGYIPAIQLCVCYDKIGQKEQAQAYNELAGKYKPNDAAYLYNKAYFDQQIQTN